MLLIHSTVMVNIAIIIISIVIIITTILLLLVLFVCLFMVGLDVPSPLSARVL